MHYKRANLNERRIKMPKQPLIIPDDEVQAAVRQYLKEEGIIVTGILHPRITFSRSGKQKIHHFGGYQINDGDYKRNTA